MWLRSHHWPSQLSCSPTVSVPYQETAGPTTQGDETNLWRKLELSNWNLGGQKDFICDLGERTSCNHKVIRVPQETRDSVWEHKGTEWEQLQLTLNLCLKPITHPFPGLSLCNTLDSKFGSIPNSCLWIRQWIPTSISTLPFFVHKIDVCQLFPNLKVVSGWCIFRHISNILNPMCLLVINIELS